ncbi:MAG: hypothetical protein AAF589_03430 [Planctomycetota bacterium]
MSVGVVVRGLTTVKIQVPSGNVLTLGYSRNAVEISEQPFYHDVPGDENGGDEGPPVDVQFLGMTHLVRMRLSKFDSAVADELHKFVPGSVKGTPAPTGQLLFLGSTNELSFRVILDNPVDPRSYGRCLIRTPLDHDRSNKFSELVVEFTAYKDASGVLFNSTIT